MIRNEKNKIKANVKAIRRPYKRMGKRKKLDIDLLIVASKLS